MRRTMPHTAPATVTAAPTRIPARAAGFSLRSRSTRSDTRLGTFSLYSMASTVAASSARARSTSLRSVVILPQSFQRVGVFLDALDGLRGRHPIHLLEGPDADQRQDDTDDDQTTEDDERGGPGRQRNGDAEDGGGDERAECVEQE